MAEKRGERVNELCTCHHLKSRHNGILGHGFCSLCDCGYYTFAGWVYKEVLVLGNGDEVLQELRRILALKGYDNKVFVVGLDLLKIAEFSVSVEVQYAYGQ